MSDTVIFFFGAGVMMLVLIGTALYTFREFRQMGQHPERYPENFKFLYQSTDRADDKGRMIDYPSATSDAVVNDGRR